MEETNAQTLSDVFAAIARQQTDFQAMMQHQFTQSEARIDALTSRLSAPRRTQPPTYHGKLSEDLELWFFAIEQFYADFHPRMTEESSLFVTMISCHLGTTPMNWYRQFSLECDGTDTTISWPTFKSAMRRRFLPPDHEFSIRERLCALRQKGNLHDYIAEFQNLLIQCTLPISPLELRFYFQEGLKAATAKHLREHHPNNLEQTIELALRFDHSSHYHQPVTADWETTATCHRCNKVGHIAPNYPDK